MRDFREALWAELISANSPADLPLRGNVVASPSEGSSRGFHIGEPDWKNVKFFVSFVFSSLLNILKQRETWRFVSNKKKKTSKN